MIEDFMFRHQMQCGTTGLEILEVLRDFFQPQLVEAM